MAAGNFEPEEAERLNAAWRPARCRTRADFIRDAVMDSVEKVEAALGGVAKLKAAEEKRQADAKAKLVASNSKAKVEAKKQQQAPANK
jgi:hypothetical protein